VIEREYTDASGIPWTLVERKRVRQDDTDRVVVILATSPFETRIIRCERELWAAAAPDFAQLLADSLPSGGSRGSHADPDAPLDPSGEDPFIP
jgi:hypothetical protein